MLNFMLSFSYYDKIKFVHKLFFPEIVNELMLDTDLSANTEQISNHFFFTRMHIEL